MLLPYLLMVTHFSHVRVQEDTLAMPMHAISLVTLIRQLSGFCCQIWNADDVSAGGGILWLWQWWDHFSSGGRRHLGYFTNAKKTWLVVKEEHLWHAQDVLLALEFRLFQQVALSLVLHLVLKNLCRNTQHTVLSSGLGYTCKSFHLFCPNTTSCILLCIFFFKTDFFSQHQHLWIALSFLPLNHIICHQFLPHLVPLPPNDVERTLFALPTYLGDFGIFNPCKIVPATNQFSRHMAAVHFTAVFLLPTPCFWSIAVKFLQEQTAVTYRYC